jgi:hypothetical protein
LTTMGMPVPAPDPNAIAAMKKEQLYEKQHAQRAFVRLPMEMVKSMPDVATASHSGQPNLNPPDDAISATDVLKPGASGPSFTLAMRPASNSGAGNEAADTGTPAEAVPVSPESSSSSPAGNNLGVEIIEAPGATPGDAAAATSTTPAVEPNPAPADPSSAPTITLQPSATSEPASSASEPAPAAPESSGVTQSTTGNGGTIAQPDSTPQKASKADTKTESTSKKKKGIHKVIPF